MANWALVIGINEYQRLRSLEYATRDAQLMRDFFQNEGKFEKIFYFSDNSPEIPAPDGTVQSYNPQHPPSAISGHSYTTSLKRHNCNREITSGFSSVGMGFVIKTEIISCPAMLTREPSNTRQFH
jgi:hypothetical protein